MGMHVWACRMHTCEHLWRCMLDEDREEHISRALGTLPLALGCGEDLTKLGDLVARHEPEEGGEGVAHHLEVGYDGRAPAGCEEAGCEERVWRGRAHLLREGVKRQGVKSAPLEGGYEETLDEDRVGSLAQLAHDGLVAPAHLEWREE